MRISAIGLGVGDGVARGVALGAVVGLALADATEVDVEAALGAVRTEAPPHAATVADSASAKSSLIHTA